MIVRVAICLVLVCTVSAGITKREEHAAAASSEKQGRSDYSAPSYSGGSAGGGSAAGSQGNLYYYYYPVQESGGYPTTVGGGDDFSVLLGLLLPLLLLGGLALLFLPLLGGGIVINTTGRRRRDTNEEPALPYKDTMADLRSEVNRLFFMYLNAVESEQCPERIFCEAGTYAGSITGKGFIFRMIDSFDIIPSTFKSKFKVLEKAAISGKDMSMCKKYLCHPPKFASRKY